MSVSIFAAFPDPVSVDSILPVLHCFRVYVARSAIEFSHYDFQYLRHKWPFLQGRRAKVAHLETGKTGSRFGIIISRVLYGSKAREGPGKAWEGPGKNISAPAEDLLNKKPSLIALGKKAVNKTVTR